MCGICGIFNPDLKKEERSYYVKKMADTLIHRGPDDSGFYIDDKIALGIRRLAVIDVEGGHQPFYNEDRSIIVVFNGEIYNYRELRSYLIKKKHIFKTNCDTEIISHLWEEFSTGMFDLLNGQFSIAIYDKKQDYLVLARDHFGIRPLYYSTKNGISFASEIKALKVYDQYKKINKAALIEYFNLGYTASENTLYDGIKRLPPASFVIFKNGEFFRMEMYWQLELGNQKKYDLQHIDELMKKSVKERLLSDVPLGLLLSGGLDSSLIAYYVKEIGYNLETFTASFTEKGFDELSQARIVANEFGFNNNSILIKLNEIKKNLNVSSRFDEPFADSSSINVYLITKFAKERVTVLLSGEGGDELFAGYYPHQATIFNYIFSRAPDLFLSAYYSIAKLIPVNNKRIGWEYKLKKFLYGINKNPVIAHYMWKIFLDIDQIKRLFPEILSDIEYGKELFRYRDLQFNSLSNIINNILYIDFDVYLPNDLLVKNDRASMLNSIESRVPFLDKELVEYMFSISGFKKVNILQRKIILMHLAKNKLPRKIIFRPKQGFSLPLAKLFEGKLKEEFLDLLNEYTPTFININKSYVLNLIEAHSKRQVDYSRQLWSIYQFIVWANENNL
jgi:asparagine synthase (glutamine-hydrolysing)